MKNELPGVELISLPVVETTQDQPLTSHETLRVYNPGTALYGMVATCRSFMIQSMCVLKPYLGADKKADFYFPPLFRLLRGMLEIGRAHV